jgi:hypothetical protein
MVKISKKIMMKREDKKKIREMKHVSGHKTAHAWHGDMVTWTPAPL